MYTHSNYTCLSLCCSYLQSSGMCTWVCHSGTRPHPCLSHLTHTAHLLLDPLSWEYLLPFQAGSFPFSARSDTTLSESHFPECMPRCVSSMAILWRWQLPRVGTTVIPSHYGAQCAGEGLGDSRLTVPLWKVKAPRATKQCKGRNLGDL